MNVDVEKLYNDKKYRILVVENLYEEIRQAHSKHLSQYNVTLPALKRADGDYTKDALVLIRLYVNYPDTKELSKKEITKFMRLFYPEVDDVQQQRHLAMQKGWYILSGTRGDFSDNYKIKAGTYKLVSVEKPHPSYIENRRTGVNTEDFEELKKIYGYRCAVCGSKEGKPHFFRKNVTVKLQQGHMDPQKDLTAGNIIPQCQICNRPDRNRWIYDKTGRVIKIADTPDGLRVVKEFVKKLDQNGLKELYRLIKKRLSE